MKKRYTKVFVGDFETTVFEGQTSTEVWASGCVELYTEDVKIFHTIDDQWNFFCDIVYRENCDLTVYYHNLKFDGTFWLWFFLKVKKYAQAYTIVNENYVWDSVEDMKSRTFQYCISDMGQFYSITIKMGHHYIEFRDSLKLLPFKLRDIGKAFNTKHQKLDMEYEGYRYAGCEITKEEEDYLKNDLLVLKEALEYMFDEGHKKITIASCCMDEYKNIFKTTSNPDLLMREWYDIFNDMTKISLDANIYGCDTAEKYIRKSYHGGWSYVVPEKAGKIYRNGLTADVNSLYPSQMESESGNYYPIGQPHFWQGDIPKEAIGKNKYYFVRIRTRFKVKENHLPFIQIKGTYLYRANECLKTSDIWNPRIGKYMPNYKNLDGKTVPAKPVLTLTCTDYDLLREQYDLFETEILDGCWFYSMSGIFDEYIHKWAKIKIESTNNKPRRTISKMFMNSLYGKFASSDESSFKVAFLREDGSVGFKYQEEHDKKTISIPVGSAITSYARAFTIRTAQANYYGPDKPGFIYADTDSIHCDLSPEQLVNVPVHPTAFNHWKLETFWDVGIFVRQKTYIEHVTHEDEQPIKKPYYNIKCAGMGERCKQLLAWSIENKVPNNEKLTEEEKQFLYDKNGNVIKRELTDFKVGLLVPSKLVPRNIPGGVLLVNSTFCLR